MAIREYENIFSVVKMFETEENVKEFFEWVCQNIVITCKEIEKNHDKVNEPNFPVIYSEKQEVLSFSYNFFIECIAKFFDVGNKDVEKKIKNALSLSNNYDADELEEGANATKARTLILVGILQNFHNAIHPNNTKVNMTHLKGNHTLTSSYYIAMVFEDKKNNPIQYAMIPMKTKKLRDVVDDFDLYQEAVEYGKKLKMKNVAYNMRQVKKYWEDSERKRKRFD